MPGRLDSAEPSKLSVINEMTANLASLNEIMVAAFSGWILGEEPDYEFVKLVTDILKDHTWRLGYEFNGFRPSAEWYEKEKYRGVQDTGE